MIDADEGDYAEIGAVGAVNLGFEGDVSGTSPDANAEVPTLPSASLDVKLEADADVEDGADADVGKDTDVNGNFYSQLSGSSSQG